jgi:hypothetical protein
MEIDEETTITMMRLEELTAEEIACLTYAMESFCDEVRHNSSWKPSMINTSEIMRAIFTKEYIKRQLDYSDFSKED